MIDFVTFVTSHGLTINILSATSSFVFAVAIYMLLRNNNILKQKDWARLFAHTFVVLGVIYTVKSVYFNEFSSDVDPFTASTGILLINAALTICSGLTNYFFLLSSILLLEAMMSERLRHFIEQFRIKAPAVTSPLFWLCLLMALIGVVPFDKELQTPDHLLSTLALLSMGYALYRNRININKVMAWVALTCAIVYAALYFLQIDQIRRLLTMPLSTEHADLVKTLTEPASRKFIALILKFGFFFSAYSLMLWISGPLQGIESLLKSVNHEENEFFENEGIVKSIHDELGEIPVQLFIRLPGLNEKLLAVFEYPTAKGEKGPRIIKYQEGTIYDKVFTKGESGRMDPDEPSFQLLTSPSEIGAPVFFHNSVIACLEVELRGQKFSEGNRINLERMANLISPAIQTYREMWALNKLSQDLTELQIGVVEYKPKENLKELAEKIFNVVSASAVGISIGIGFKTYSAVTAIPEMDEEVVKKRLRKTIQAEDVTTPDGTRWLSRELVILWRDDDDKRQKQVFGNFILALKKEDHQKTHTAIGTNATFRRALSDLVSDRLLSFIRGHLNQVTDRLGTRLSGLKGATLEGWEKIVNGNAVDAGLKWALANSSTNQKIDQFLESLNSQEAFASANPLIERDGFSLFKLKAIVSGAQYVIKKTIQDPDETFWFGVGTKFFLDELKYASPWRYFLDHFCEIAYSALVRLQVMKREEILIKNLAFVDSVYSDQIAEKSLAHNISEVHPLRDGLAALRVAVDDNSLNASDHGPTIQKLYLNAKRLSDSVGTTLRRVHDNNRSPCSLNEVLAEVRKLVDDRLAEHSIALDDQLSEECIIHLPFHVAKAALKTIIDNSIDAIRDVNQEQSKDDDSVRHGKIEINVWTTKNKIICAVTDNGPGVSERILPRLFTEVPESSKTNGHGIGLYLAKNWLLRFGGDIVHRRNGSNGACFLIEFPLS